ncbi:hypothetical protein RHMOL_Rhmol08G0059800 [Rhododendron molle]|uniref:Uncharacterized protein n=1 Tax=Rhododendron molle TaxID=49168 RepID=A0ACC0MKK4_RHOML|nr:hypothetical protein RHMOL_Rhmol08G0059800 [Rhododendron molle]
MDTILCDELLEEVLRRLPPGSTFSPSTSDVSLVSKRWLRLYRSSRSRLSLRLSPDNCTPSHSLSSFLSHFPHLPTLRIFTDNCEPHSLSSSLSSFPDQILLSVASSCPNLTHLRLPPEPVSHFPLLSLPTSCPHLTHLIISLSRPLSFHWLVFFHSLVDLVLLVVPGDIKHVDDSKGTLDAELKLDTLSLCGIRHGDYGFDWLWKSCTNLQRLRLQGCEGIGDDTSVSSFVNCFKGLQEVELRRCGSIVNEILTRLVENVSELSVNLPPRLRTMALAMSNKLEELALINCEVEPGLLTTLGQKFRNLRDLDLSYNERLVDKEFILMLASCNCLRELTVKGCKGLTNASVVSMFKSFEADTCRRKQAFKCFQVVGFKEFIEALMIWTVIVRGEEYRALNFLEEWVAEYRDSDTTMSAEQLEQIPAGKHIFERPLGTVTLSNTMVLCDLLVTEGPQFHCGGHANTFISKQISAIQQSPRQLALAALSVSQAQAESMRAFVAKLTKFKGLKAREHGAIKDCLEEIGDSADRIQKSIQELNAASH